VTTAPLALLIAALVVSAEFARAAQKRTLELAAEVHSGEKMVISGSHSGKEIAAAFAQRKHRPTRLRAKANDVIAGPVGP